MLHHRFLRRSALALSLVAVPTLGALALQQDGSPPPPEHVEGATPDAGFARQVHQRTLRGRSLGSLLERSELAFVGEVVRTEVVKSLGDEPGRPSLPFTFVTYRVDELVRGTAGDSVTLRFIGGLDEASGKTLRASTVPVFEVGDTDLLFVVDNGRHVSPLVDQLEGRFRVVDGALHGHAGTPLVLDGSDGVLPRDAVGAEEAVAIDAVLAVLATRTLAAPEVTFVDANPRVPFRGPDFTAVPPPATTAVEPTISAEEAAERALEPVPVRPVRRRR